MRTELSRPNLPRRIRSFTLVMTVLILGLLIAVTMQMATTIGVEGLDSVRRQQTLQHELAVESAILLLGDRLAVDSRGKNKIVEALDRTGMAEESFELGGTQVVLHIRDDGAKLNPRLFQEKAQAGRLQRKLEFLKNRLSLPGVKVGLRPIVEQGPEKEPRRYRWFDQLLTDVEPGGFFRWGKTNTDGPSPPVWSDVLTFWGDGRIDLRRASPETLEAALEDIQPGLASRMMALRPADRTQNFLTTVMTAVPAERQQSVSERINYDGHRYAITLETRIQADQRRWYVVATIRDRQVEVLHRSQITW